MGCLRCGRRGPSRSQRLLGRRRWSYRGNLGPPITCSAWACMSLRGRHNEPVTKSSSKAASLRVIDAPPLLTRLHDFADVRRWTHLENVAIGQCRMLRHELYSVIHVPCLKDENA